MNYILKTPLTLLNCGNDGKSPMDSNWIENAYLDLKAGTEVILQKEVYISVIVWRVSTRVDGIKFHKIIKEER